VRGCAPILTPVFVDIGVLGLARLGGTLCDRLVAGLRHCHRFCRGRVGSGLLPFTLQQRIFLQGLLDLLVEFQRRQLQKPYRLLQLRRQREVLRELEL